MAAALRVVPGNQLTLANSDLASVGTLQDIAVESRRAAQREKPMLWLPKLVAVIRRVPTNDVDLEVRHLVHHGSVRTPPTWRATVDEIWSAVHRGGARGGRLSVDGACNQEPDGDTRRRDSDLDRFGPSG